MYVKENMYRLLSILWIILLAGGLTAQIDSIVVSDEVVITNSALRQIPVGSNTNILTIKTPSGSLPDLLSTNSNIFIKNYGPGSLSTPSIRGGSAGHTLILWNGLPLHSPTLGLLDFSLIGNVVADEVSISKGGNSTLWGSGAVSGTVALQSSLKKDYTLKYNSEYGSFGSWGQSLAFHGSNSKWTYTTKFQYESSDRDFTYSISPDLPLKTQENAAYSRSHLLQDVSYLLHARHRISVNIWLHKAYTEIPATITQTASVAYQNDKALRSALKWDYTGNNVIVNNKIGYFIDENHFTDEQSGVDALNTFSSIFAETNAQWIWKTNHRLLLGGTYNYTKAVTDGYGDGVSENRLGLFTSYKYEIDRWQLQLSARQEFVDTSAVPVMPAAGVCFKVAPSLSLRGKVSRDYRLPTLNDRYWTPGGNINLLPESGWSQELGVDTEHKSGAVNFKYSATAYHRKINNWILWSPSITGPFWQAQNINTVRSQGLEQELKIDVKIKEHKLTLVGKYDYTLSTFEDGLTLPIIKIGDQLIYTPIHSSLLNLAYSGKYISVDYHHRFTGSTRGVNKDIAAYDIGGLSVSYRNKIYGLHSSISCTINNLWDTNYFIIERRPLAGRNYNISITFKY